MLKEHDQRAVSAHMAQPGSGDKLQGCSQPWQGRCLWFLFQVQGKATRASCPGRKLGQVQAALCLAGCEERGQQGTANRPRQLQLGRASPGPDTSAAVPPGPGPCAGAASRKASREPWHSLAQHGVPQGQGKSQPAPGPAGFTALRSVRALPWAGFLCNLWV